MGGNKKIRLTKSKADMVQGHAPAGAGDRGRTGTVSLPSDFESDTSANSITPAHNTMIITHFSPFVKQTTVISLFTCLCILNIKHIRRHLTFGDYYDIIKFKAVMSIIVSNIGNSGQAAAELLGGIYREYK